MEIGAKRPMDERDSGWNDQDSHKDNGHAY
jgi:hypothetical protein